jgi:hypothetical protein
MGVDRGWKYQYRIYEMNNFSKTSEISSRLFLRLETRLEWLIPVESHCQTPKWKKFKSSHPRDVRINSRSASLSRSSLSRRTQYTRQAGHVSHDAHPSSVIRP